jgi:hypothetical protein
MRDYQPIWHKLKTEKVVSITANRRFHPRIVKAVIKEKWMDFGYKLEQADEGKVSTLAYESTGAILKFTLEVKQRKLLPFDLGFHIPEISPTGDSKCHDTPTKPPVKSLASLLERLTRL